MAAMADAERDWRRNSLAKSCASLERRPTLPKGREEADREEKLPEEDEELRRTSVFSRRRDPARWKPPEDEEPLSGMVNCCVGGLEPCVAALPLSPNRAALFFFSRRLLSAALASPGPMLLLKDCERFLRLLLLLSSKNSMTKACWGSLRAWLWGGEDRAGVEDVSGASMEGGVKGRAVERSEGECWRG